MPNYANSPLPQIISTFTSFYFAEGTTRTEFDPYLCIQNPGAIGHVTITYMKGDGTTVTSGLDRRTNSRADRSPWTTLGVGDDVAHDFAPRWSAQTDEQISPSAPCTSTTRAVDGRARRHGRDRPADTFYFAEGNTGAGRFEEWLCHAEPGPPQPRHITYMFADGARQNQDVPGGAHARTTSRSTT